MISILILLLKINLIHIGKITAKIKLHYIYISEISESTQPFPPTSKNY